MSACEEMALSTEESAKIAENKIKENAVFDFDLI